MNPNQKLLHYTKTVILATALVVGLSFVQAWTGPTQSPAGGNTPAPINVSATSQVKSGGLGVTNLVADSATVGGSVYAGAFFYNSDQTLKRNIKTLNGSLDKVLRLRGVSFDWKTDGEQSVGVIAQEVEKVYPELVNTDERTGLRSVEYANLVGPLIEAVKELEKKINAQQQEIQELQKNTGFEKKTIVY